MGSCPIARLVDAVTTGLVTSVTSVTSRLVDAVTSEGATAKFGDVHPCDGRVGGAEVAHARQDLAEGDPHRVAQRRLLAATEAEALRIRLTRGIEAVADHVEHLRST